MNNLRIALLEHKEQNGGWYGFDLDGTLAKYISGDGVEGIGEPVQAMVDLAKELIAEGKEVRILTARIGGRCSPEVRDYQVKMIGDWTEEHIGQRLAVTCEKDPGMIALYDDRAIQVVANTGELVE